MRERGQEQRGGGAPRQSESRAGRHRRDRQIDRPDERLLPGGGGSHLEEAAVAELPAPEFAVLALHLDGAIGLDEGGDGDQRQLVAVVALGGGFDAPDIAGLVEMDRPAEEVAQRFRA